MFELLHEKILREKELTLKELQSYVAHNWENVQNIRESVIELEKNRNVKDATDRIMYDNISEIKTKLDTILTRFNFMEGSNMFKYKMWKIINIIIITIFGFVGTLCALGIHEHILKNFFN